VKTALRLDFTLQQGLSRPQAACPAFVSHPKDGTARDTTLRHCPSPRRIGLHGHLVPSSASSPQVLTPTAATARWAIVKKGWCVLGWIITSASACGGASAKPAEIQPLDPAVAHYGKTYAEWAAAWTQWVYQWPVTAECLDPVADSTGELCNQYQDGAGPVFFLTGNWGTVSRRDKCKAPPGKPLLIPIIVTFQDNGGVPAGNVKTDAQLKLSAERQFDAITETSFSLDGHSLQPLGPYGVKAAPYEYTLPEPTNIYTCQGATTPVTGTYQGYTSGYFVLLPPLPSGPHKIALAAKEVEPGAAPFNLDVSYDPIVIP